MRRDSVSLVAYNVSMSNGSTGKVLAAIEKIAQVKGIFFTEESTFSDFFLEDKEMKEISKILETEVCRHDKLVAVMERLDKRKKTSAKGN